MLCCIIVDHFLKAWSDRILKTGSGSATLLLQYAGFLLRLGSGSLSSVEARCLQDTLKWSGSFFLKHNKSFRWHLGDYEKHIFFSIWRPVRGETLIFVCFYGCVVCPLKPGLYKLHGRSGVVTPGHTRPPGRLPTRKYTHQSKFLLSQAFKWKKIMFFVIPEMPSKTFVML